MPVIKIARDVIETIMDALQSTSDTKGSSFALPVTAAGARTITWQTSYAVAPGAVNMTLEGAIEDVDARYSTLDTSTQVNGELRTVTTASAIKFIRAHQNSRTGGTAFATVKVSVS